jgi:hypothetical protein
MNSHVSLTITPLLSLKADQEEKLCSCPNGSTGKIMPIHLEIQNPSEQQHIIINEIKDLPVDSHTTVVFLFSLPQALVKNSSWLLLIHW